MKTNRTESRMYAVMGAIYESGIPIDFKGAMVLHALLYEHGYAYDAVRPTRDIDANWFSGEKPTMDTIQAAIQKAVRDHGINLDVKPYRPFGDGQSAGLEFCDENTHLPVFTMDMDVNRPATGTRIYHVDSFSFRGVIVEQMLADKIFVISTGKVFRRIKDVIDLYYLSHIVSLDENQVTQVMKNAGRVPGNFECFLKQKSDLRHAYEKFRFGNTAIKPDLEMLYNTVAEYIQPFLPL